MLDALLQAALDPAEVVARPRPAPFAVPMEAPERAAFVSTVARSLGIAIHAERLRDRFRPGKSP